jgi:hypothetical protein
MDEHPPAADEHGTVVTPPLTPPESAAAIRAYLQRCEVRLSTVHRVASALLSGAGLVVLFPALAKDSVARVLRALLEGTPDAPHRLMVAAVFLAALLPLTTLWLLLRDLVRFYFAGHHFETSSHTAFFPRFALSGLRIASTDVDAATLAAIEEARHDPNVRAFLLPENAYSRHRADVQGRRYGLLPAEGPITDEQRRVALLELSATGTRTLAQQAARMEQVLARHVLNLQSLVLRYAKAVLAMLTTTVAMFAAAVAIDHDPTTRPRTLLWMAAAVVMWAPLVTIAVTAPVNWVMKLARSDNATDRAAKADREFTLFEDTAVRLAVLAWMAAFAAIVVIDRRDTSAPHALTLAVVSLVGIAVALARWDGWRSIPRILGLRPA